jgi:uncharacterized protein YciI
MIVVHVAIRTVEDYHARREPYRRAHLERLTGLRTAGIVVGGGPAPDGRTADVFYRLSRPDELAPLVEGDPYFQGGAWSGYTACAFTQFVEPWEAPPVVIDGSRRVAIVEGPAADLDLAQFALIELRGAGRLAFGGFLDAGHTLAVLRSADPAEAAGWLAATGFWASATLQTRPFIHVL